MVIEANSVNVTKSEYLFGPVKRQFVPKNVFLFMRRCGIYSIVHLLNSYSWGNIKRLAQLTESESAMFHKKLLLAGADEMIRYIDELEAMGEDEEINLYEDLFPVEYITCMKSYWCPFYHCNEYESYFMNTIAVLQKTGFIIGYEKRSAENHRFVFHINIMGSYDFNAKQSDSLMYVLFSLLAEEYVLF